MNLAYADESSLWLAAIVESCDDAIISKDLDGIFMTWNKGAQRIFGYTPEEAIGRPATILIPADRQDEEPSILERLRRGQRVEQYETVRLRKDGQPIDISLTVSPVKNPEGKIIGASKIARDITHRKRQEERIIILAAEAEHRTKNILASVQALVRLSQADTAAKLKETILQRIHALATVHGTLIETQWAGANIHRLANDVIAAYCGDGNPRISVTGPDVVLNPEVAQIAALVLNELGTNAAKYGALRGPEGRVHIEWSHIPSGLAIRWTESRGPHVSPPTRHGFGTRAMQRLVAGQLGGTMKFDWQAGGLSCEIFVPFAGSGPQ